jgi:hypothetical protein
MLGSMHDCTKPVDHRAHQQIPSLESFQIRVRLAGFPSRKKEEAIGQREQHKARQMVLGLPPTSVR